MLNSVWYIEVDIYFIYIHINCAISVIMLPSPNCYLTLNLNILIYSLISQAHLCIELIFRNVYKQQHSVMISRHVIESNSSTENPALSPEEKFG